MIRNYTKEAGVRELERVIATMLRKIVKELLLNKESTFFNITEKDLEKYLGKKKYFYMENVKNREAGVVNGMAYTVFGGDVLPIEVNKFKGKGNLTLTGSLGEVMQESCQIALDYIKSNTDKFKIKDEILQENDIHIHVPEGAVNKDGPSAGITITTAIISLLLNKPIDNRIAMTGEITLRGRILAIGGLKEKVIGSHRAGVRKIFIPSENKGDIDEIPEDIKNDIEFICVRSYQDVFNKLFKESK